jgi:hypothetical protein
MKEIKGFKNYLITEDCKVINKNTGRTLRQCDNGKGYKHLQITNSEGFSKMVSMHRLMYINFKGDISEGLEVNHIDGNKGNNTIDNLELVTRKENIKKAVEIGLIKSGFDCRLSKSVKQIDVITHEVIKVHGSISLAHKDTGISISAISSVCNNRRITAGGYKWEFNTKK